MKCNTCGNNIDKIILLKELLDTRINNKVEVTFYTRDDEEFKTLTDMCQKQGLHGYNVSRNHIHWVYYHNGRDEEDTISANIVICIFKPKRIKKKSLDNGKNNEKE